MATLRFAASSTFAQLYIVALLPDFLKQHADFKLDMRHPYTLFDLIEGCFDLMPRWTTAA